MSIKGIPGASGKCLQIFVILRQLATEYRPFAGLRVTNTTLSKNLLGHPFIPSSLREMVKGMK
jgi:hypothetical protein